MVKLILIIHTVHIMLTIVVLALLAAGSLGFLMEHRIVMPIEDGMVRSGYERMEIKHDFSYIKIEIYEFGKAYA